VKRLLKPISYLFAAIYLCVDFIFAGIALPISRWLASHFEMRGLRDWIRSLPPYACLALLAIPVIILEPVKFLAAYLAATGNVTAAVVTFCVGELLKLVLIERLFNLTRDKLMSIPAFAWVYAQYLLARNWITQLPAWRSMRSLGLLLIRRLRGWRHSAHRCLATSQGDR
jgi:hypothetical protein